MQPFIKDCFIFKISDLLGPRGHWSVWVVCLVPSGWHVGPLPGSRSGTRKADWLMPPLPHDCFPFHRYPMENGIYIMYWSFQFQNLLKNLTIHTVNCLFKKKFFMRGGVLMDVLPHSLSRWPLNFLSAIITLLIFSKCSCIVLFLDFTPIFSEGGDGDIIQVLSQYFS